MKSITKKIAIILLACLLALSVVTLVACKSNVYTVTVVDEDGNPYTSALVQLCKVESNGNLSTCYEGVATDSNGVAKLELGKEIPDTDVDYVEVHLLGLPSYLTYDSVKMHKGDSVTVTVKVGALSTPTSGTGVGAYDKDWEGNVTNTIDLEVFKPYFVGEGAYALKFTDASQKIYYEFRTRDEGVYKVYSVGSIDASVTQLVGVPMTGIRNTNDSDFSNDNVSATDKNFSYEFEVSPDLITLTKGMKEDVNYGSCFFEVALSDSNGVGVDAIIVFEFVSDYEEQPEIETIDVTPAKTLTVFDDPDAYYTNVDVTNTNTYVMGEDGYYHWGNLEGPVLVATLGNDWITPEALDMSFLNIYLQGQTLTFYDSEIGKNKNYAPLVEAYSEACNSDGRYPLTDELIDFFKAFVTNVCGADWLKDTLVTYLPEGEEWLIWCGYYYEGYVGSGTEDDPYTLDLNNTVDVEVPQGGSVYYSTYATVNTTYTIISDSTNIKLSVYKYMDGAETAIETESDTDGFYFESEISGYYYFVFSTKDGNADNYSALVLVSENVQNEGTMENPIIITELGTCSGEVQEVEGFFGPSIDPIYFSYTTTEAITLYFDLGPNTIINYINWVEADGETWHYYANWENGLELPAGATLQIEVMTADGATGTVSFTLSDSPIAG